MANLIDSAVGAHAGTRDQRSLVLADSVNPTAIESKQQLNTTITFNSEYFFTRPPAGASSEKKKALARSLIKVGKEGTSIGPFVLGKQLGEGSIGKVILATHHLNGFQVAIKILRKKNLLKQPKLWATAKREIAILKLISHPHIMKLYDVLETEDRVFLIQEYVRGGDLYDYINSHGRLKEAEALRMIAQCIQGLEHCHAHFICHRDLKPENLLLDDKINIKIADFGMAQITKHDEMLETNCGSPHYASPEIILGGAAYDGKRTDVWSIGVVFYAMVCGALPFDGDSVATILQRVVAGKYTIPSFVSSDVADLIRRMLTSDPKKRIQMQEIKLHKAFKAGSYFPKEASSSQSAEAEAKEAAAPISEPDEQILRDLECLSLGPVADIKKKLTSKDGYVMEKRIYRRMAERRKVRLMELQLVCPHGLWETDGPAIPASEKQRIDSSLPDGPQLVLTSTSGGSIHVTNLATGVTTTQQEVHQHGQSQAVDHNGPKPMVTKA